MSIDTTHTTFKSEQCNLFIKSKIKKIASHREIWTLYHPIAKVITEPMSQPDQFMYSAEKIIIYKTNFFDVIAPIKKMQ